MAAGQVRSGLSSRLASFGVGGGAMTPEAGALWLLVALELGAMVLLRRYFRRHHGG